MAMYFTIDAADAAEQAAELIFVMCEPLSGRCTSLQ
jgi:hypothetical protein